MKKKLLIILLAAVSCFACVFGLAACDNGDGTKPNGDHQHNLVAVQGKSATCTETGILEHWRCETCDKLFSDKNGTAEIENTTIPALGHDFVGGVCTRCGAADPNDDSLLDGKELKNINISAQGILTWSRLKIASKYSVKISSAEGDRTYEIPKSEGSFDLNALPENEKLRYGKNSVTLTVYQYQEEQIGGETIGDDVPVSSDSFLAVSKNGGYSLVRTTYADENLTIKGAYSDVREDTDGNEYILIDKEIPQGNKDVSFNLSQSVKEAAENVTVKYYKNEIDRANDKNAISGNNWHREVIKPGDNFYYLRVTCADGSGKDYTVKVCGVRYVTFYFMSFVSSGKDEDGYNVYQYESIGESTVLLENDYFDIDSLYASIDENKVIIDENRNVYEKGGDYMVPFSKSTAASASFSLFCADKTFIDAQKAEVELYKDLFELTYSGWTNGKGNQWLLRFKADSAETNLVVPSEIFGDRVVLSSDSFRNAANLQSVIFADGFTSLPDRLFANGCASLESVTIPASITSAYSLGDWMFSEDLKDQLTIYCEGDIESDTWNRVPGQMAFFRTYINQEGASSTVTVNGVRIKVDAAANEAEVLSASGENIVIPDTVRFGAKYYPVTSVKENAAISAVSVFLGKNIESLGEGWFANTEMQILVDEQNEYFTIFDNILYTKTTWEFIFIPSELATSLIIPEGVTKIPQKCFENHSEITEITLPSSLEMIETNAFKGCTGLVKAKVPAAIAGYLPLWLESITITEGNLPENVFSGRSSLKTVELSKGVTGIGSMAFEGCTSLTSIMIPDSVTRIGSNLFYECDPIVYCEAASKPSGWNSDWSGSCPVVWDCNNNEMAADGYIYIVIDGIRYALKDGTAKVSRKMITLSNDILIPGTINYKGFSYYVTEIGTAAFRGSSIESITIPKSVTSVGSNAFEYCSLREVHISDIAAWCAIHFANATANPLSAGADLYLSGSLQTELVIPNNVIEIGQYAFYDCKSIESVTIPASVTAIKDSAFYMPNSLKKVFIVDAAAWCKINFADFNANPLSSAKELYLNGDLITDFTVPNGIESVNDYAFYNAVSLRNVILSDSVISIGCYAFSGCDSLTSITIPSGVTAIKEYAFQDCGSLADVRITDIVAWCGIIFDYNMANPLYYAENLYLNDKLVTELVLPDEQIDRINSYAFHNYEALTSVTIPQSVEFIRGHAFDGCVNLTIYCAATEKPLGWDSDWNGGCSIVWDCSNNDIAEDGYIYTVINGLRYALKDGVAMVPKQKPSGEIVVSKTISYAGTLYNVGSIVDSAFENSESLTGISIPAGIHVGNNVFHGCSSLESASVPADIIKNLPKANLKTLVIVSGTVIDAGALSGFSALENLTVPFVGTSNGSGQPFGIIFGTKEYNGSVETPQSYNNESTGKEVKETYYLPAALRSVTVTGGNIITKAFFRCSGLVSVTLSAGVTSVQREAFSFNYQLTVYCEATEKPSSWDENWNKYSRTVWDCNHNDVAEDGYIYTVIDGLRYALKDGVAMVSRQSSMLSGDIIIPARILYKEMEYAVTSIGFSAFSNNVFIRSVVIPNGVTEIEGSAFFECSSLTSVTVPASVTAIGEYAFYGCDSMKETHITDLDAWCFIESESVLFRSSQHKLYLNGELVTNVIISDGVTKIGSRVFSSYGFLESITIPNSIKSIGESAFSSCSSLSNINFNGTKAQWNRIEKYFDWNYDTGTYTIHCTDGDITKS